jgi:hypothetical protein
MNRMCMSQIMQPWLLSDTRIYTQNAGAAAQTFEGNLRHLSCYGTSTSGTQEWRIRTGTLSVAPFDVPNHNLDKVGSNRHQPRLIELGIADMENACNEINVRHCESECLTDPKCSSI